MVSFVFAGGTINEVFNPLIEICETDKNDNYLRPAARKIS